MVSLPSLVFCRLLGLFVSVFGLVGRKHMQQKPECPPPQEELELNKLQQDDMRRGVTFNNCQRGLYWSAKIRLSYPGASPLTSKKNLSLSFSSGLVFGKLGLDSCLEPQKELSLIKLQQHQGKPSNHDREYILFCPNCQRICKTKQRKPFLFTPTSVGPKLNKKKDHQK